MVTLQHSYWGWRMYAGEGDHLQQIVALAVEHTDHQDNASCLM
jgi:hypothetical protein